VKKERNKINTFELKARVDRTFFELEKLIAGSEIDRSRSSDDRRVYLLALAGKKATVALDFMEAVGEYLSKVPGTQNDQAAAKAAVMKALELFLARQKGRRSR